MNWEELCERGRLIRENMDTGRWLLGDMAIEVDTRYGDKTLADFAREVGISKSSLYSYRAVSCFFPIFQRSEYFAEYAGTVITYGHYRAASRLPDLTTAKMWLDRAALDSLTVDYFNLQIGDALTTTPPGTPPIQPPKTVSARHYHYQDSPVKPLLDPARNRYVVILELDNLPDGAIFASVWSETE